jgi:hypothetical protein
MTLMRTSCKKKRHAELIFRLGGFAEEGSKKIQSPDRGQNKVLLRKIQTLAENVMRAVSLPII